MFQVPVLETCLCCCSLKTGATIIAVINFLIGVAVLSGSSYLLPVLENIIDGNINEESNSAIQTAAFGLTFFACSLLYGIHKKRPYYLEPWLIMKACIIVILFLYVCISAALLVMGHTLLEFFFHLIHAEKRQWCGVKRPYVACHFGMMPNGIMPIGVKTNGAFVYEGLKSAFNKTQMLDNRDDGRRYLSGWAAADLNMFEPAREVYKVPILEKCCCGYSLEVGAKIIAFINIFLIGGSYMFVFSYRTYHEYNQGTYYEDRIFHTFSASFLQKNFMEMAPVGLISFAGCLLYGIDKKDPVFLEPWLILKASAMALSAFNICIYIVIRTIGHRLLEIFWHLLLLVLEGYMYIVVHNLYLQLKNREQ